MDNLFAIALILILATSIVVAKLTWMLPNKKKILISILVGFIGMIVTIGQIPVHACHAGGTIAPPVFTALSLFIICAFSGLSKSKYAVLLIFLIIGSAVVHWSVDIVHNDNCTGNRNHASILNKIHDDDLSMIIESLRSYPASEELISATFPAGWIEDVWEEAMNEPLLAKKGPYIIPQYKMGYDWHSWFSGIYQLEKTKFGIWCDGGQYPELIDKLELKK